MRLTWLPGVLQAAGLNVRLLPGWEGRGRSMSGLKGIVCHHTATSATAADEVVARILRDGRPDLKGPLAQLGLDRAGVWWVIADGKASHNGYGTWGNDSIGVEAFNNGRGEPWPAVQLESWQRGCAAMCRHLDFDPSQVKGHKETDPNRKIDPLGIDMTLFRTMVKRHLWTQEAELNTEERALLNDTAMRAKATQENVERILEVLTKPLAPLIAADGNDKQATPRWAWFRSVNK